MKKELKKDKVSNLFQTNSKKIANLSRKQKSNKRQNNGEKFELILGQKKKFIFTNKTLDAAY